MKFIQYITIMTILISVVLFDLPVSFAQEVSQQELLDMNKTSRASILIERDSGEIFLKTKWINN